ncbi:MAG: hypothetical protein AAF787_09885 [Chloroflexota bacterium]
MNHLERIKHLRSENATFDEIEAALHDANGFIRANALLTLGWHLDRHPEYISESIADHLIEIIYSREDQNFFFVLGPYYVSLSDIAFHCLSKVLWQGYGDKFKAILERRREAYRNRIWILRWLWRYLTHIESLDPVFD